MKMLIADDFNLHHKDMIHVVTAVRLFLDGYASVDDKPRFLDQREHNYQPVSLYNAVESAHFLREILRKHFPNSFWTPVSGTISDGYEEKWHAALVGFPNGVPEKTIKTITNPNVFLHIDHPEKFD